MIKLKIITKKEDDLFIEEIVENVYDFDFDFAIGNLIIKHLEKDVSKLKLIPIKNIKRIIGYELNVYTIGLKEVKKENENVRNT